jgi:hypothetical protein
MSIEIAIPGVLRDDRHRSDAAASLQALFLASRRVRAGWKMVVSQVAARSSCEVDSSGVPRKGSWFLWLLATLLMLMTACTPLPDVDPNEPATVPDYGPIVSKYFAQPVCALKPNVGNLESEKRAVEGEAKCKSAGFGDALTYYNFEISGLRWVHGLTGFSWLVCVRFQDRGHQRAYALFFRDTTVLDARYAVISDNCGVQNYVPFDILTGTIGRSTPFHLPQLY